MLRKEQNDLLTRTGPGTPMGEMFRRCVSGIAMQDASLQESMGAIIDRSKEHLTATDNGIVMARGRLMRAAQALADKGLAPPGTDPATHGVRSASVVLPAGAVFQTAAAEALTARPGIAPASV